MSERELLMIPGPTNVDPSVLRSLSKPTISHVSLEFAELFRRALEGLKKVFMTNGEVVVIAGSGTLAMEMALANFIKPGDNVLNLVSGFFGQRFVDIAKCHGAKPTVVEVGWGEAIEPHVVERALKGGDYKAVTITHVETSTGVANPIKEVGEVVKGLSDALYVVDAVSSLGGMEVRVDEWDIDVCLTGSQKCLGVPPGLALLALSKEAIEFIERRKEAVSLYYGDLRNWLPVMRDPLRYFATPPVNAIYALDEAVRLVLDEGLERRFKRHRVLAEAFRAAIDSLGLRLVSDRRYASDTVTAVYYPSVVEDAAFRSGMKRYGVIVAAGLGPLRGKCFRVGHMGNVNASDTLSTIGAMEMTLRELGYSFEHGAGLRAAQELISSPKC